MNRIIAACLVAALPICGAQAQSAAPPGFGHGARVSEVYQHPLPDLPGMSLKGVLVEYAPGGGSPAHTHARSALIYATVLQGAVRIQLNGGPVRVYTRGQNFTESPGDRHDISQNASDSEPATLLAVFVVRTDDVPLTTPIGR